MTQTVPIQFLSISGWFLIAIATLPVPTNNSRAKVIGIIKFSKTE